MIVAKLMGGLGNQMFQYSLARYLSLKYSHEFKLDVRFLLDRTPIPNFTFRDFELNNFELKYLFAKEDDLKCFKKNIFSDFLLKFQIKTKSLYFREGSLDISKISIFENIYLDGFWQSEKYFSEIRSILLNDFSIKKNLIIQQEKFLSELHSINTVSVHIRRGDYVSNEHNQKYHGTCSIEYYLSAIEYLKKKIDNLHFLFISDDIEWVIENFKSLDVKKNFITLDVSSSPISDLYLMTKCKHNIIANSTFSWWGAWLNNNSSKIVIAPSKWANVKNQNLENIIPDSWITI